MKKTVLLAFTGAVLLAGCSATNTAHDIPEALSGHDIFTGAGYRYGPSVIVNDNGSIDAWFAAPGGYHGDNVMLYDPTGEDIPVSISPGNSAAQRFSAEEPFYAVGVQCPCWSTPSAGLTLSLYPWKGDYSKTVAAKPLATARFDNYEDNEWLSLTRKEKFAAGDYLWVLNNGATPKSGAWKQGGSCTGTDNYFNGELTEGSYRARITLNESAGSIFWDQASYQHSDDGGKTWTPEKMVLKPTEGSRDSFSVCDPGVAKWGGYYYIGYTSTENPGMVENHVYVCRGTSPEGPWEKWNGSGWGGNPQPIIEYTGDPTKFGAGEPSMVVVGDTLYFYYTWNDSGDEKTTTRLATAPAGDPNWPAHLTLHGTVINKSSIPGADHCDVKYRDDLKKFQAIHTASRMSAESYVLLWESEDGIHFRQAGPITGQMQSYLHNCGWGGDAQGHIDPQKHPQYISYAYGSATAPWGQWKTWWAPLKF